jgi:hypothetical protein
MQQEAGREADRGCGCQPHEAAHAATGPAPAGIECDERQPHADARGEVEVRATPRHEPEQESRADAAAKPGEPSRTDAEEHGGRCTDVDSPDAGPGDLEGRDGDEGSEEHPERGRFDRASHGPGQQDRERPPQRTDYRRELDRGPEDALHGGGDGRLDRRLVLEEDLHVAELVEPAPPEVPRA